jgi:hypothetical protein
MCDVIACFLTQFCKYMDIPTWLPPEQLALAMVALIDGVLNFNSCMPNEMSDISVQSALGNSMRCFLAQPPDGSPLASEPLGCRIVAVTFRAAHT